MASLSYIEKVRIKMDAYAHCAYDISKSLPSFEKFGLASQLRRASTSVILNFLEGYARRRPKVFLSFLETSFGSLKETQYILVFLKDERMLSEMHFKDMEKQGNEIGAMLWTLIQKVESDCVH